VIFGFFLAHLDFFHQFNFYVGLADFKIIFAYFWRLFLTTVCWIFIWQLCTRIL